MENNSAIQNYKRLWLGLFAIIVVMVTLAGCSGTPEYVVDNQLRIARGNYEDAILDYKKRLTLEPRNASLRYYLARAYFDAGDLEGARKEIDQALIIKPLVADYRILAGKINYQSREYFEAINHLSSAIVINANSVDAYYFLALCLNQTGKTAEALGHLGTAIQLEPYYFSARIAWAKMTFKQIKTVEKGNEDDRAVQQTVLTQLIENIKESLKIKPDSVEGVLLLTSVYQYKGDLAKAKSLLMNWVSLNLANDDILLRLANIEYEEGRFDTAREYLNKITTDPRPVESIIVALKIRMRTENAAGLMTEIDPILEQYPDSAQLMLLKGRLLLTNGENSEAEKSIQKALQIAPDFAEGYFYLSEVYRRQNDTFGAGWALNMAVSKAPEDPKIQVLHLSYLVESRQWVDAEIALKNGNLNADHPEVIYLKGVLAKEKGDFREAEKLFAAASRNRFSIRVELQLAELEARQKKFFAAENRLNKLFALYPGNASIAASIAKLYLEIKRVGDIPELLTPFMDVKNVDGDVALILGDAYGRIGNLKECLSVLAKGVDRWPSNWELLDAYTFYLGLSREYESAIRKLERIRTFPPTYEQLFYSRLRTFYYLSGQQAMFREYTFPYPVHPAAERDVQ